MWHSLPSVATHYMKIYPAKYVYILFRPLFVPICKIYLSLSVTSDNLCYQWEYHIFGDSLKRSNGGLRCPRTAYIFINYIDGIDIKVLHVKKYTNAIAVESFFVVS